MKDHAVSVFHKLPENLNCAQAVLDAWQRATGLEIAPMEDFRAFGGGRAPEGECGALHAACLAVPDAAEAMRAAFVEKAGSGHCGTLKRDLRFPCADCVGLAAQLLQSHLTLENPSA
ncbi:MAG: hypothetical protein RL318_2118 [Fibrobacterota bacterium]|jgi:hypothetical protein